MSTIRTPTGPLPKGVYWRRRIVLLLLLVAVIAIIAIIVWPRGGDAQEPPATGAATGTPSGEPGPEQSSSPPPAAADGERCDPAKVDITAETDASNYDADASPQLWLTITSRQATPCALAVGSDVQEYRITSGDELIWSSADCQVDPQPYEQVLQPGVPVSTNPITWDRTRSSADTCDSEREAVVADGASYHLEVQVGELVSKETKQFLLN